MASGINRLAPNGDEVLEYDRVNLALYAALLEANDAGRDWRDVVATVMALDLADAAAEACWRSHLERALWIVGEGLEPAVLAFTSRKCAMG